MVSLLCFLLAVPDLGLPKLDIDTYLAPPDPPVVCVEDMTRFDPSPVPIDEPLGIKYTDDGKPQVWLLRPGLLISECEAVNVINLKTEHQRMKLELRVLRDLRDREHDLWDVREKQFQVTVEELQDMTTPGFWDEWKAPIMYGAGVMTAVAILWATAEIVKTMP